MLEFEYYPETLQCPRRDCRNTSGVEKIFQFLDINHPEAKAPDGKQSLGWVQHVNGGICHLPIMDMPKWA